jgi:hypothetical protein
VHLDEATDGVWQCRDAAEGVAVNGTPLKLSEPPFDGVQPRDAGRGEVEADPGVSVESGVRQRSSRVMPSYNLLFR